MQVDRGFQWTAYGGGNNGPAGARSRDSPGDRASLIPIVNNAWGKTAARLLRGARHSWPSSIIYTSAMVLRVGFTRNSRSPLEFSITPSPRLVFELESVSFIEAKSTLAMNATATTLHLSLSFYLTISLSLSLSRSPSSLVSNGGIF